MNKKERRILTRLLDLSVLQRDEWEEYEDDYLDEWMDLTTRSVLGDLLVQICKEAPDIARQVTLWDGIKPLKRRRVRKS